MGSSIYLDEIDDTIIARYGDVEHCDTGIVSINFVSVSTIRICHPDGTEKRNPLISMRIVGP